jgi:predicted nucleic acid-binding protein
VTERWILNASPLIVLARVGYEDLCLNIKGTLAVVILAKQRGLIPSVAGVLRLLRGAGFRIDDESIHRALASTVGEVWT